jgi:uncharacterized SAM-binding protein YcdF (DUF218 family)
VPGDIDVNASPVPRARLRETAAGLLLGALAGLLLGLLGIPAILGLSDEVRLALLGAAVGAAVGWAGRPAWLLVADGALLIACVLIGLVPWTALMDRWVREDPSPPAAAEAIVVLSSGVAGDSTLSDSGADRLLTGLELFRDGVAPRIVTTRVVGYRRGTRVTTDADQRRLVGLAGADSAWAVVDSVGSTRDEAMGAAELLLPLGARDIVVVTSASHTRRACLAFEKVGFRVWCRPALERDRRTWHARSADQRLSVFRALLYELLGMVKYRVNDWI